jgi:hypothetical protein
MQPLIRKILAASTVFAFIFLMLTAVQAQSTSIGVKEGDWIEYSVVAAGSPPPEQDLNWARIEILNVEGTIFHANFTVRYTNGSISSGVRTFNFSAGNVQAWIIIPANLNPSDYFYDSSIGNNVTIQGQLHKNVAGANREVTFTNTTERHKEWDKASGVYVASIDNLGNYTINAQATATNMWRPQILGFDQTLFMYILTVIIVIIVIIIAVVVAVWRKRKVKH